MKCAISLVVIACFLAQATATEVSVRDFEWQKHLFEINEATSIAELKSMVSEKLGIPVEDLRLVCHHKNVRDDDKVLHFREHEEVVELRMADNLKTTSKAIFIAVDDGLMVSAHVNAKDTVSTLKDRIKYKEGASLAQIFFDGKELEDSKTLEYYKLYAGVILTAKLE